MWNKSKKDKCKVEKKTMIYYMCSYYKWSYFHQHNAETFLQPNHVIAIIVKDRITSKINTGTELSNLLTTWRLVPPRIP